MSQDERRIRKSLTPDSGCPVIRGDRGPAGAGREGPECDSMRRSSKHRLQLHPTRWDAAIRWCNECANCFSSCFAASTGWGAGRWGEISVGTRRFRPLLGGDPMGVFLDRAVDDVFRAFRGGVDARARHRRPGLFAVRWRRGPGWTPGHGRGRRPRRPVGIGRLLGRDAGRFSHSRAGASNPE